MTVLPLKRFYHKNPEQVPQYIISDTLISPILGNSFVLGLNDSDRKKDEVDQGGIRTQNAGRPKQISQINLSFALMQPNWLLILACRVFTNKSPYWIIGKI